MPVPEKQLRLTASPTNAEGGTLLQGEVVAAHTTADQVVRASAASDGALARVYGFVLPAAGIATSTTGEVVTKRGTLLSARFEGSLTLTPGDRVYVSPTVAGSVTNVRPSTVGQVVLEVGRITSTLIYNGTSQLLAQIQLLDGERLVVTAGGSPAVISDASNETGALIAEGAIVAVATGGNKRIQLFSSADAAVAAARYVGVVTEAGGIADTGTGEVTIVGLIPVLMKASLTLASGDEFYPSGDTPGSGTNLADLVANPPASGGVRQHLGLVFDASTYDGVTNLLATCVVYVGGRRQEP